MRTLSLLALLLLVLGGPASAQTSFQLVEPILTVDGDRVVATGAPLSQERFGLLTIEIPAYGTYTVSEEPFAGARRAGQFDGRGLYFSVQGHSVRLLSREPILSIRGPISAYVKRVPPRSRQQRGLARLALADDPNDRGRRATPPPRPVRDRPVAAAPAPPPPSPALASAASTLPELSYRPAARYLRDAEVARLRGDLDRLVTDRSRLADERERLRAQQASRRERTQIVRAAVSDRPVQLLALEAERDRLAEEGRRLASERTQLAQAFDRVSAERDALALQFADLRARVDDSESRASAAEVRSLRAEVDRLRDALRQRDGSIAILEAELAERGGRLPGVEAELVRTQRLLADAVLERDAARADRDVAIRERDVAVAEVARLRADLVRLEAEVAALEAGGGSDADRRALRERLQAAERARDALARERDELADEVLRLRAELAGRPVAAAPVSRAAPPPPEAPVRAPEPEPLVVDRRAGPIAYLPGFDFGRLQNPDDLQRRLDAAVYPARAAQSHIAGDVLVLFETDATGRVTRSAVPAPVGGGLDALAEDLVRSMRFEPPRVDGEAAPLRSQVLVRFEL